MPKTGKRLEVGGRGHGNGASGGAKDRRSPRPLGPLTGDAAATASGGVGVLHVGRSAGGGLAIQAAATGGYDVASGDRTFKTRTLRFEGADRPLDSHHRRQVVSMARELDRNSLLSAMLDRWCDGVVGSHLNFRPNSADAGWNQAAYDLVRQRMNSPGGCDHRGFFDAAALTRTMLRAIGTDGEQLWAMTDEGAIQAVETHQMGTPRDRYADGGRRIVDGIELDDSGRPLGYWVSDEVYGGWIGSSRDATFVPADRAILPAYRKRASQTHGVPLVAAALKLYDRVDGYIDNEALAAEIDACLTFFVKQKTAPPEAPFSPLGARRTTTAADGTVQTLQKIEPGMIGRIAEGEDVEQFGAKRPGNQFTPFVEMGLTMVGATIGVPLPLALLDFKRLNYSNARTMLLQMWQTWQIWYRQVVVPAWQWVYQRWVLREIARSAVLRARDDAFNVKWLPRRWPWVDPLKEVQALREEIAMGGGTLTDHLESIGYTLEEYLAERGRELKAFAAAGVPTTTLGGQPVQSLRDDADDEDRRSLRDDGDEEDERPDDEDEEVLEP